MFAKLRSYITSRIKVSDEEFETVFQYVSLKKFKKNEIILHRGNYCNFIGFLNNGIIRCSYADKAGKDITFQFIYEGCFFTYAEALIQNIPSHKNFIAIEDCEALMMEKSNLQKVFSMLPKFETLFSFIITEDLKQIMLSGEEIRSEPPQKRYLKFINQFPDAFNQIPLKHIASYLGIEPQSLSRIRKRLAKK